VNCELITQEQQQEMKNQQEAAGEEASNAN